MKYVSFIAGLSLITGGCVQSAKDKMIKEGEATLNGRMLDPGSIEYKDVFVSSVTGKRGTKLTTVCGLVNGKNAFGGYVGFRPFYVVMEHTVPAISNTYADKSFSHPAGTAQTWEDTGDFHAFSTAACDPGNNLRDDDILNLATPF